ncbi:hypothetical protein [Buttiauxella noackiae]|uniref:hypothetical protein n=1 Tax=Buttiauxella noackiae TaxID=82992 RepID=UPI000555E87D|nr:hypothetical protein [Buttiauxella noackiae]
MAIELDPYNMVVAVNNLNDTLKETNYFKDYVLPIASLIVSGLFGYIIAIRGYKWQESVQNERMKVDAINKTILMFQDMQNNLIAIKTNYYDWLSHHPLQRVGCLQNIIYDETVMVLEAEKIVQIGLADSKKNIIHRLIKKKVENKGTPWLNASYIITTVSNYNYTLKLLKMRNEIDQQVKEELTKKYGPDYSKQMSEIQLRNGLSRSLFVKYFDISEFFILQMDNMIININDFLLNYPGEISKKVNEKFLSNYKVIGGCTFVSPSHDRLVKRTTRLDINLMASFIGMGIEEALQKYGDFRTIKTG